MTRNAVVNVVEKDGLTPLHYAARGGHLDIVIVIIDYVFDLRSTFFVAGAARQQGESRRHRESRLDATSSCRALWTHQHHQSKHGLHFARL